MTIMYFVKNALSILHRHLKALVSTYSSLQVSLKVLRRGRNSVKESFFSRKVMWTLVEFRRLIMVAHLHNVV